MATLRDRCASTGVCDALLVLSATGFVVWKLQPALLLTATITAGGDTASHYYTAWWLRHELLPQGRIAGWVPGNYAGFPLFQVYFPLPFVVMAVLSLVIGLPVAFKLVSVAGVVLLPLAAYGCFRLLGFAFPAPALAAVFTLPFLFHEANSVWGANIVSTLAGELTYSTGTALLLVLTGSLYRGVVSGRGRVGNAFLLAAVALNHAYTVLAAAALGAWLVLFHPSGRRALPYLVGVAALAFGLIAFWALPLLAFAEYTTAYSIVWPINGFTHVFPSILWPLLAMLGAGVLVAIWVRVRGTSPLFDPGLDERAAYLASLAAGGVLLYLAAWKLDVVDIRFLPFVQLTLCLLAALPAAGIVRALASSRRLPTRHGLAVATLLFASVTLAWVNVNVGVVGEWAAWNYSGFEAKEAWPAYRAVNDAVARTSAEPRVVYEHTAAHDEAGSVRAFESLPLFSGASTLEGLYMQSTISSPFVFYIQSEISQIGSCPLLPYHCARLDAARAAEHLRLFNVSDVITRGEAVTRELAGSPEFTAVAEVPPYQVFRVEGNSGAYVEPLRYRPILLDSDDWKRDFFTWFKRPGSGEVVLVRAVDGVSAPEDWIRVDGVPDVMTRRPYREPVAVEAEVGAEEIRIRTSAPGRPLLVKISYHPRWSVTGAEHVWLASPSLMLIVPSQREVTLSYGRSAIDRLGIGVSLFSLLFALAALVYGPLSGGGATDASQTARRSPGPLGRRLDVLFQRRRWWAPAVAMVAVLAAVASRLSWTDPWVPHREGLERFHGADYEAAEPLLLQSIEAGPSSTAAYYSAYYYALCAYRTRNWEATVSRFSAFLRDYPDGEHITEGHYRIGEALEGMGRIDAAAAVLVQVMNDDPRSTWAGFAAAKLETMAAGAAPPESGS